MSIEIDRTGVERRSGFGTGFLVPPNLLLTNNHVLPEDEAAGASIAQFNYLAGWSGKEYEPIASRFAPATFFITDKKRDFTLVAVEDATVGQRGYLPLIRGSGKAITGETVNILQHRGGERLQVVVRDNTILNVPQDGQFMQYCADTKPGSSGARVLNDQWELVALHHAGVPKRDSRQRILLTDGSVWNKSDPDKHRIAWESNEGVRISSIVSFIDAKVLGPEKKRLWSQCFEKPTLRDIWQLLDGTLRRSAGRRATTMLRPMSVTSRATTKASHREPSVQSGCPSMQQVLSRLSLKHRSRTDTLSVNTELHKMVVQYLIKIGFLGCRLN